MSIKVRYFASLKEKLGRAEHVMDVTGPVTVAEIWTLANPGTAMPDNIISALNMEYVDSQQSVKEGDEVAFFPPVTGG
ncbi:MAG: molybdopterin converting factor subunit 1 [Methylococcaceae bacterium]|jgi:molybdopterin synthase sulfur carrier subunit